jgi:hypothetical protein
MDNVQKHNTCIDPISLHFSLVSEENKLRMKWKDKPATRIGEMIKAYKSLLGKAESKGYLGDVGIDKRIIFN